MLEIRAAEEEERLEKELRKKEVHESLERDKKYLRFTVKFIVFPLFIILILCSIFKIISQYNLSGPIMVLNSDIMTNINYQDVYDYYKKNKTDHMVCVKEIKTSIPYGVCKIKNKQLVKIEEKIELSNYINAGIYIFNSSKLKKMKHNPKIDMDELLKKLILKRNKIITFPINEFWIDLGTPSNINRAKIIDALTI